MSESYGLRRRRRSRKPGWESYVAQRAGYMRSAAWFRRRKQWFIDEEERCGRQVECPGCGRPLWPSSSDMHHATYERMGHEDHEDLLAMCRDCHELLHRHLDVSPRLRRWIKQNPLVRTRQFAYRLHGRHLTPDGTPASSAHVDIDLSRNTP